MKKMFYVYELIDPRTNIPFYVGKGQGDRYKHHRYNRNKFPDRPVSRKIIEILSTGYQDIRYSIHPQTSSECDAYRLEQQLIERYGREDLGTGILLNKTNGGEGWSHGRTWTEERHKIHIDFYEHNPRGESVDQYTVDGVFVATYPSSNHAVRLLKLPVSAGVRIRLCCRGEANSSCGFMWTYTSMLPHIYHKKSRKPVTQYTKECVFVATFVSGARAEKTTGIRSSAILAVCDKAKHHSAGGFLWTYQGDPVPVYHKEYYHAVSQYHQDGTFIADYRSLTEASYQTGVGLYAISSCCRGRSKTSGGFLWEYVTNN